MSAVLLMPLLNEGTDVLRPATAQRLDDGTYRIRGPVPDDEEWTLAPGSIVASEPTTFGNRDEQLVAVPIA